MFRVCLKKSDNSLIEMQSDGYTPLDKKADVEAYRQANLDTLKYNAIQKGYIEEDIIVKFMTNEEWQDYAQARQEANQTLDMIVDEKIGLTMKNLAITELMKTATVEEQVVLQAKADESSARIIDANNKITILNAKSIGEVIGD